MKVKSRKIQWVRHSVQILAVLVMLLIPVTARYSNFLSARELDRHLDRWEGTLPGAMLGAIDWTLRALPGGEVERVGEMRPNRQQALERTQALRGGPWSAQIGPLSMTDPLAGAESVLASKRVTTVLLIGLAIPIIATFLFGRVFCSWICPVGFLLECTDKLRGVLVFLEVKPSDLHFSRMTKYILLGVGLALTAFLGIPILGYLYPPAILGRESHDFVFALFDRAEDGLFSLSTTGLTWMSLLLLAIVLFEVVVSRRWWCRYLCPGGALYGMIGAARPVRVELDESACTRCSDCVRVCPVGLDPMNNAMGIDCDNCGLCISHCNDKALEYRFGLPFKSKAAAASGSLAVEEEKVS